MARVLLLTAAPEDPLPSLALLGHRVHTLAAEASSIVRAPAAEVVLIDARTNLAHARSLSQLVKTTMGLPAIVIVAEAGLATLNASWLADDFILTTAGPAKWRRGCAWRRWRPQRNRLPVRFVPEAS